MTFSAPDPISALREKVAEFRRTRLAPAQEACERAAVEVEDEVVEIRAAAKKSAKFSRNGNGTHPPLTQPPTPTDS